MTVLSDSYQSQEMEIDMNPTGGTTLASDQNAALRTAALAATGAITEAVVVASKAGVRTSEFKAVIGGILFSGLLAGIHALSIIPGPWMVPALAVSAGVSVAAYALGRSKVKAAALVSAAAVITRTDNDFGAGLP